MSARSARQTALLLAFTDGQGPVTCNSLMERTGWSSADASKALSNAKTSSLIVITKPGWHGDAEHGLTDLGRKKLADYGPAAAGPRDRSLAERALDLIDKAPAGLNSGDLADTLGTTAEAVEEALGLHVISRRLVACAVKNSMGDFTLYRVSAGLAQADLANTHWKKTTVTPLPAPAPAPAPKKEPVAKVIKPTDGCDIDAVHRTANTIDMEPVAKADQATAARIAEAMMDAGELPPPVWPEPITPLEPLENSVQASQQAFVESVNQADTVFFVDTIGRLRIEHGGEELRFTRTETLGLLRYLTHIDALGLVESIEREAA